MDDLIDKILKTNWQHKYTRELPLRTIELAAKGYVKRSKDLFGWSCKHVLFVASNGYEDSYRDSLDIDNFITFLKESNISEIVNIFNQVSSDTLNLGQKLLAKIKDVKDIEKKSLKKIFIATDDLYTRIAALLGNTEQVAIVLQEKEMKKELEEVIKIHQDQGGLYPKLEKALEIIYSVLSDELNINIKLLKQATVDEVMNYLSWKNFTNKDSLQDRFNLHALYYDLQGSHIITDSKAELIKDKLNNTKTAISGDINGQVAFKGVVKGKVKIVKGENDLKKLNYGDIIVTPMTQVSYTPYLKTINGIVTDEGGVTCHAAIISRELGKPCIIGTKIATQVLKDGDEVEVDTNEGVVRIIFKEK